MQLSKTGNSPVPAIKTGTGRNGEGLLPAPTSTYPSSCAPQQSRSHAWRIPSAALYSSGSDSDTSTTPVSSAVKQHHRSARQAKRSAPIRTTALVRAQKDTGRLPDHKAPYPVARNWTDDTCDESNESGISSLNSSLSDLTRPMSEMELGASPLVTSSARPSISAAASTVKATV